MACPRIVSLMVFGSTMALNRLSGNGEADVERIRLWHSLWLFSGGPEFRNSGGRTLSSL